MKPDIDILIVAEGTYPYVSGGVSTWIHRLITSMKEFTFGVVFIGGRREDYGEKKYSLPENLVHLEEHFMFESPGGFVPKVRRVEEHNIEYIKQLHMWFKKRRTDGVPEKLKTIRFYTEEVTEEDFLYSKDIWRFIKEQYINYDMESPFVDYFWTIRNMHMPVWKLAEIARDLPSFSLVHSPSTGYAGFLASLLRYDRDVPFVLTEHGIYTRERKIDIMNADWLEDRRFFFQKEHGDVEHLRQIWIGFFESIGRFIYSSADPIISLFDGAREVQIKYGASPEKTRIIPNGIELDRFTGLRRGPDKEVPRVVALVGRVVPIKDVKTFINAIKILTDELPDVQGWIVGPTDEDPDYYEECAKLVDILDLEGKVIFWGLQDIENILPRVGLVSITSISEGMPLVVLEAFGAGVPVVATDVGSCRQLIYGGLDEEDVRIGRAGEITPIANPHELASAYKRLLVDREYWNLCQQSAIKRVETYYRLETMIDAYRQIYAERIDGRHRV